MYMKVWTFFRYLSSFSFYLPAQEGQSRSHYIQVQINFLFDFYFLYYPISFILFKNNNIWTMEYRNRAKRVSQHMIRGPPIPKDDEMGRENSSGTQKQLLLAVYVLEKTQYRLAKQYLNSVSEKFSASPYPFGIIVKTGQSSLH